MTQSDTHLRGVRVIEDGFASELEYMGARIDGPLWPAHVLEDEPDKVLAGHRAYIATGSPGFCPCSSREREPRLHEARVRL